MGRACDRCDLYDSEETMCAEYSFANGLLSWLCFDCRKDWVYKYSCHEVSRKYDELMFKLEFYQLQLENSKGSLDEGLAMLYDRFIIEKELRQLSQEWLNSA